MSLIHADNFNIYGNNVALMTNGRYAQASGFNMALGPDPDGISPLSVLRYGEAGIIRRVVQAPTAKVAMGFRVWLGSLPADDDMRPDYAWLDASNQVMMRLRVNTTGSMTLYVRDSANGVTYVAASTAGPVITANAWWHVEALLDASTKDFELRIEGITKMVVDGADIPHPIASVVTSQVHIRNHVNGIGGSIFAAYKDFFMWDGLGSENTDFLGTCIVAEQDPVSDVSIGGWEPSTGTVAWDILDTSTPGETPHLSADDTPPAPMRVNMSGLPDDITSIKGAITIVRAKKIDGGDGNMQVTLISNGDRSEGADRPITAAMTYWEDVHEIDPDTGAPWTPLGLETAVYEISRTV